ncbi:MAG: hypothetical protein ACK5RO_12050 [Pseudobdellovibrionaceae bacterium]|jgi:glutathione-regulated potassium-efflux system protein KefB
MAEKLLNGLGLSEQESKLTVDRFRKHDLEFLARQHAVYQDEAQIIQTAKQAMSDLETLFEIDSAEIKS